MASFLGALPHLLCKHYIPAHNHTSSNFECKSRLSFLPVDPLIFAATKSGSIYEIENLELIMNIFIRSSRDPWKKGKRLPRDRDPRLKSTALVVSADWVLLSSFCDYSNLHISVFN